ncbi:hypothetical protein ACIQC5_17290 [Paenarthrobacter sp. NPDC092416]|uniref:hypothetical protein n=1 Tax=Paenarthrobacter sp. NPDC092416 TaxID=3364386 RepID=UPI003816219F
MMLSSAVNGTAARRPKPVNALPIERSATGTALGAFGAAAVMGGIALVLNLIAEHSPLLGPVFAGWSGAVAESPLAGIRWFLGDMTEPQFYKSELAAIGLLAGAALAWWAGRRGRKWAGSLTYGTGLWPWVFTSASLSLLLSNVAFGWMLDAGWQPTFVPFVCVASAVVLVYGGGWTTCLTGAALGAATTTPLALLLIPVVSTPLGLPSVVSNVLAMSIGSVLAFLVARKLPWLEARQAGRQAGRRLELRQPPSNVPAVQAELRHTEPRHAAPNHTRPAILKDAVWAGRRVLSDFTETQFFANELASAGVILGVAVAFVLNPALPSYGSNLVPHILFAQALTSAVGVVLWRSWYRNDGWAATYASLVSVAPAAVLAFNGSWFSMIGGAVLGAVMAPPIARAVSARLPRDFHPSIGNTVAMAVSTAVTLPILRLVH